MKPQPAKAQRAWHEILKSCGYPTTILTLDFESYFDDDFGIRKLSTVEYINDNRFEVLCLATQVATPDTIRDHYCPVGEELVETALRCFQKTYGDALQGVTVLMQNAPFDASVLAHRYGIYPQFIVDLLGLSRAWNSRSKNDLAAQCKRWGLPPKGDTEEFKELTLRMRFKKPGGRKKGPKLPVQVPMFTPEQVARLVGYANNDVALEWRLFEIMLPLLSRPEIELPVMQTTIEMFTKPVLAVNHQRADEIAKLMEAEVDKAMEAADVGVIEIPKKRGPNQIVTARERVSGDNSFMDLMSDRLMACGDSPIKYIKYGSPHKVTGVRKPLLAIAKDDEPRAELVNHPDEGVRLLMDAKLALDSWPNHASRVRSIQAQCRATKDLLCVPLKYHGAHTGRDSGGEGINLQNLGSRGHELVNAVREIIIAPAGKALVIVDAAAVEARGTAWIAGEWQLCDQFEQGVEIYCGFAARVLGTYVRKPIKEGKPGYIAAVEKRHTWARNMIGKVGILGCGYGMGTDRIWEYANRKITIEVAEKIKTEYRTAYANIVQFWRDVEKSFVYTAKYKRPCEMPRGLRFHSTDACDVVMTLPSGREIHYVNVKLKPGKYSDTIEVYNELKHSWGHVWGGHLTENIVQGFCRDLLMESMLRLKAQGIHTAHRVHDELVIVVDKADAKDVLKIAETEMARRPAWGQTLPLGAEGLISPYYKK